MTIASFYDTLKARSLIRSSAQRGAQMRRKVLLVEATGGNPLVGPLQGVKGIALPPDTPTFRGEDGLERVRGKHLKNRGLTLCCVTGRWLDENEPTQYPYHDLSGGDEEEAA